MEFDDLAELFSADFASLTVVASLLLVTQSTLIVLAHRLLRRRRGTVQALAGLGTQLRLAAEAGALAAWEWTRAGGLEIADGELTRRLGCGQPAPCSDLGRWLRLLRRMPQPDRAEWFERIRAAQEKGCLELEVNWRGPRGSIMQVAVRGRIEFAADGSVARAVGICLDLSALHATADAMAMSHERFAALVHQAPGGFLLLDAQGTIFDCNRRACAGVRRGRGYLLGKSLREIVPEADFRRLWPRCLALSPGEAVTFRTHCRDRAARMIAVEAKVVCLPAGIRQVFGAFVQALPETSPPAVRDRPSHMTHDGDRDYASAALAHELRQPIAAMVVSAQAARCHAARPDAPPFDVTRYFDDIIDAGGHAVNLINGMLAMGRRSPDLSRDVAINDVARAALRRRGRQLDALGVTVRTLLAEHLPVVRGDPDLLEQVVGNLVLNAAEAMAAVAPGARVVTVRTGHDAPDRVYLAVTDCGPGIGAAARVHLFQPFRTTKREGHGLGLTICKDIVLSHHGEISANNHDTGGAVFTVTLPANPTRRHAAPNADENDFDRLCCG